MKTIDELFRAARELASALFHTGPELQCQDPRCLQREEDRPLTKKERDYGWTRRPFTAYDSDKLCGPCRAYWFAEMAAQTLHRLNMLTDALGPKES